MSLPLKLSDWTLEARYLYEERAGIMEFEGGLDRKSAEREAERDVRREWDGQGELYESA